MRHYRPRGEIRSASNSPYSPNVGEHQLSASEQAGFVDDVIARSIEAEARCGAEAVHIEIAGVRISIRFSGPAERFGFSEAFEHVRSSRLRTHQMRSSTFGTTREAASEYRVHR